MYHAVTSGAFHGMESFLVQVEVDISNGLPGMDMVGCLASEVKETKERVRVGLKNSGYELPVKRITISLSPADLRKDGSGFDLPVAIGILGATLLEKDMENEVKKPNVIILGEIGLDGGIKRARGILPILLKAAEEGITHCILPHDNRCEASNVKHMKLYPVRTLEEAFQIYEALFYNNITKDIIMGDLNVKNEKGQKFDEKVDDPNIKNAVLCKKSSKNARFHPKSGKTLKIKDLEEKNICEKSGEKAVNSKYLQLLQEMEFHYAGNDASTPGVVGECSEDGKITVDFNQIIGQEHAKRAAMVAAAGFHNLLLFGAPGSGKSMIAQRLPGIMKNMSYEECLDVTKIYSVAGLLQEDTTLITKRPFMSPHHSASDVALVGGGTKPRPGVITLAHKGILFLDELPEFGRYKLDLLRQPIEEKTVQISRMNYTCNYQADFMLVGAMNPCPCGFYPDRSRCSCSEMEIRRYLGRISGPLLDRIDLSVEVGRMTWEQVVGHAGGTDMQRAEMCEGDDNHVEPGAQGEKSKKKRVEHNGAREKCYVNPWSTKAMKKKVEVATALQLERNHGKYNSRLDGEEIDRYCALDGEAQKLMKSVYEKMGLSMRSLSRMKKVARTIADLDGADVIGAMHLSEAVVLGKGLERLKKMR